MLVLQRGYSLTLFLAVLAFGGSTRWLLYSEAAPSAWLHFALCGLVGIITAYLFVWISQYYTDYKYRPVRVVAEASTTGETNLLCQDLRSIAIEYSPSDINASHYLLLLARFWQMQRPNNRLV